jgi:hypothetical protein
MAPIELHFRSPPDSPLRGLLPDVNLPEPDAHVKLFFARECLLSRAEQRRSRDTPRPFRTFCVDDLVLLRANPISSALAQETKKFMPLFEGPYRISKVVAPNTYILVSPVGSKERGMFNACHLKLFQSSSL